MGPNWLSSQSFVDSRGHLFYQYSLVDLKGCFNPKASKDRERNVRYIKGGLLRKGGYLASVDGGPKKQHFPAFSQNFYFATLNNVLSMLNNALSTLNNVLSTVCPWFVHALIF